MKRTIVFWLMLTAGIVLADNIYTHVTAITNNLSKIKIMVRKGEEAYADTSTVAYDQVLRKVHTGANDTGYAAATADADSGGIHLSWSAATGTFDAYMLWYNFQGAGNPEKWKLYQSI